MKEDDDDDHQSVMAVLAPRHKATRRRKHEQVESDTTDELKPKAKRIPSTASFTMNLRSKRSSSSAVAAAVATEEEDESVEHIPLAKASKEEDATSLSSNEKKHENEDDVMEIVDQVMMAETYPTPLMMVPSVAPGRNNDSDSDDDINEDSDDCHDDDDSEDSLKKVAAAAETKQHVCHQPHLRRDCHNVTRFVTLSNIRFRGNSRYIPPWALIGKDGNAEMCNLCQCYVCGKPAKDCPVCV
jgi:hypothetical protein